MMFLTEFHGSDAARLTAAADAVFAALGAFFGWDAPQSMSADPVNVRGQRTSLAHGRYPHGQRIRK